MRSCVSPKVAQFSLEVHILKPYMNTALKGVVIVSSIIMYFSLTVTTAKSMSDEELQNSSSMILSAGPGNKENDIHRTVILSNSAIATLPDGMKQFSFRFCLKKNAYTVNRIIILLTVLIKGIECIVSVFAVAQQVGGMGGRCPRAPDLKGPRETE